MRRLALVAALVTVTGCAYFQKDPPAEPWEGKIYIGDTSRQGLYRAQGDEVIRYDDKRYDDMVCMSAGDFKDLVGSYRYFRAQCEVSK